MRAWPEVRAGRPYIGAAMAEVHFHIQQPSSRASYAIGHVLRQVLGWEATELHEDALSAVWERPLLLYGEGAEGPGLRIHPSGALAHGAPLSPTGQPEAPFPVSGGDLPHDLFAGFFYRSTLAWEATMPRDAHGRPAHGALMDAMAGTHLRPLVEEWALDLAARWRAQDPRVPLPRRAYRQVATMDVDNGFMYLGREPWRTIGSALRDLLRGRPGLLAERLAVLSGRRADPYDVYALLRELTERSGVDRRIINFLVAPRGPHDHAVGLASATMRERIGSIATWAETGIHPSYRSSEVLTLIAEEKEALERVLGRPVEVSRQHFLRFHPPSTQRALLAAGIREEHSVGFADGIGFRAATCTPYRWYDLERETPTGLLVVPFQLMDSAMAYRMGLSPAEAITQACALVDVVRSTGGVLSCVWHERFLSDHGAERGWRRVVASIIEHASAP